MNIFDRVRQRARGKTLYDLHPELLDRVPILRISSDEASKAAASLAGYYESNVWVQKALRVWADNIAPLRRRVVDADGQEIENHELNKLLAYPNDQIAAADLWRELIVSLGLAGELGVEAVKSKSGRVYLELWPRAGDQFSVRVESSRYRRVRSYRIDDNGGEPYELPPDQLIHFKFYNPLNVWRGLAPLHAARIGVVIDQLAQAWTQLFFRNQARPDFAIIAPQGITNKEKEDLLIQLDQQAGGADGIHRPIVLEQGITDIKTFSFPPKDLEWLEQRRMGRDEVGGVFGVPDEIMGYGKDTYENFETADRVLWTLTLVPVTLLVDNTLSFFFHRAQALEPDNRIETDLSNIPQLQRSNTEKVNQLNILAGRGYPINTANEFLGLGLPNIPGGDVGYLPFGLVPVTSAPKSLARRMTVKGKGVLVPEYGSAQHRAIWEGKQKRLNSPVEEMQRVLKKELQRQQNDIARRLRDSRSFGRGQFKTDERIPPVEELFDMDAEVKAFIKALKKSIEEAIAAAGQAEIAEVIDGGLFDVRRPEVAAGIRHVLETVARKTNETTWNELVALFQAAEAEGEGIPEIQERLSAYYGDRKSDWQTERIARTTMTGSNNFAANEAWQQSEVVSGKIWISALLPERTRDTHAEAHGQTVKLNEMYSVGGAQLAYPGDPDGPPGEVVNCLCVEQAIVNDE